jgi:hypothetical protein
MIRSREVEPVYLLYCHFFDCILPCDAFGSLHELELCCQRDADDY